MHRICTIAATNYIPQALAFLESVREFHPKIPCTILITDALTVKHRLDEHTELLTTSEIGIDPEKVSRMELYYDQVEFATSLKPYLLKHLLSQGSNSVTFIDPDTQLFGELDSIFKLSEKYDAILTPHRITPIGPNSNFYSESTFLEYGTYNLGFISVGQLSFPLVNWWAERLEFESTRYLNDSIFTDQKWANQFPAYFDCYIYKAPDLNVAPWNLDERRLNLNDGKVLVGEIPLRMVHFSQMSSVLAAQGETSLWETMIAISPENKELLTLINRITEDYKFRLKKFSNYRDLISLVEKPSHPQYASFYRNLIRKHFMLQEKPIHQSFQVVCQSIGKLKFLDRSETFNALVKYLPADLSKVLNYFKIGRRVRNVRRNGINTGGKNFLKNG